MEICDFLFLLTRKVLSGLFLLHGTMFAQQCDLIFCLTIIRERGNIFASPIIVVYNSENNLTVYSENNLIVY